MSFGFFFSSFFPDVFWVFFFLRQLGALLACDLVRSLCALAVPYTLMFLGKKHAPCDLLPIYVLDVAWSPVDARKIKKH